jgi:hypothetical protein
MAMATTAALAKIMAILSRYPVSRVQDPGTSRVTFDNGANGVNVGGHAALPCASFFFRHLALLFGPSHPPCQRANHSLAFWGKMGRLDWDDTSFWQPFVLSVLFGQMPVEMPMEMPLYFG